MNIQFTHEDIETINGAAQIMNLAADATRLTKKQRQHLRETALSLSMIRVYHKLDESNESNGEEGVPTHSSL